MRHQQLLATILAALKVLSLGEKKQLHIPVRKGVSLSYKRVGSLSLLGLPLNSCMALPTSSAHKESSSVCRPAMDGPAAPASDPEVQTEPWGTTGLHAFGFSSNSLGPASRLSTGLSRPHLQKEGEINKLNCGSFCVPTDLIPLILQPAWKRGAIVGKPSEEKGMRAGNLCLAQQALPA